MKSFRELVPLFLGAVVLLACGRSGAGNELKGGSASAGPSVVAAVSPGTTGSATPEVAPVVAPVVAPITAEDLPPTGPVSRCFFAEVETGVSSCGVKDVCANLSSVAPAAAICLANVKGNPEFYRATTVRVTLAAGAVLFDPLQVSTRFKEGNALGNCLKQAAAVAIGLEKGTKNRSCEITFDPTLTPVTEPPADDTKEISRHKALVALKKKIVDSEAQRIEAEKKKVEAAARAAEAKQKREEAAAEAKQKREEAAAVAKQKREEAAAEAKQKREEAQAAVKARQCEGCRTGIEQCKKRVKARYDAISEQSDCTGFFGCLGEGMGAGVAQSMDEDACEKVCEKVCN